METNELLKMIDEYFDGELQKSDEQSLFVSLSANEQARNYFRQNRLLKSITSEMQEAFPEKIEKKILSKTVLNREDRILNRRMRSLLAYAALIALFFISLFFYSESVSYKHDIARINNQIENKDRTIKRLVNSLPLTEIKAQTSNEVIIKEN
jgi:hypothetical protein